ncbi:acyl CoA synthetase, long chain fatty acid:CoA ligase [Legionella steigerwaltii]|uniref:Acyl CoA synthetase, long chain fatty acid:CoA ligase n=1 Tax=Legionella steigerwaltii TaxID=460 RepID=A0A378LA23_9GAMM|nr:AMP-binding protein [Legionella steigerwaltii]KTD79094.1 acyl CoA synthetase, long chain fatty acid:CoA ligase [Legionella steigerwaltii]STY23686.1 acyl CoA synthetase, long chain fatty acid:CoA ligase [Legionella steigerwaltii]
MYQLNTLLAKSAEQFPDKIALIIDQQSYTYKKLYELTHHLAVSFLAKGISQGDRVAFLLPNSIEIVLCYYACFMIGAIAVPVNIQFNNELIHYVLEQSKARIFITTSDYYKQLLNDKKILKEIDECYLTSESTNYSGVKSFQELLLSRATSTIPNITIESKEPALIFFTSGTTGLPKVVVHSHYSLSQGTGNQIRQIQINHTDQTLVMFPVCYLIGLGSQILPFHAVGATVVLLPSFSPEDALAKLHSYGITKIYGFPKLYLELINHAESLGYEINTLDFCFSAGDATPVSLQKKFNLLFHAEITEGCGMSELQIYSMNPPYGKKKTGSIGFPIEGMEMRLIDEQGNLILKANQTGEIIVRGESMCSGYWQNPALTKTTIKNGWLHTGDLAYRDEEGYYWFVSRKVDIIRCGKELISPMEIENIFYQHYAVKEAAAIALPNKNKVNDDKIIVYVVLKIKEKQLTPQTLMDFAHASLPISKRPYQIIIIGQLPYGFTGKIDRNTLREMAQRQLG